MQPPHVSRCASGWSSPHVPERAQKKCPLVTPTARGFPWLAGPQRTKYSYTIGRNFKSRICSAGWDDGAARTHTADNGRCLPRIRETCGRCGMAPSRTDAYILTGQSDKMSSGLPTGKGAFQRMSEAGDSVNFPVPFAAALITFRGLVCLPPVAPVG